MIVLYLNWDEDHSNSEVSKTVVVFGAGRGGTSLVSGVLRELGFCMGENPHPLKHEVDLFPDHSSSTDILTTINYYDKKYKNWGWKSPKDIFSINRIKHHLRSPYFILIFRNVIDIAKSANKYNSLPYDITITETLKVYSELAVFIKNTHFPIALLAYEHSVKEPENLVLNLLKFLGIPKLSKAKIKNAIKLASSKSYSAIAEQLNSQDGLHSGMLLDDITDSYTIQKPLLQQRINELTAAIQSQLIDMKKAKIIELHLINKIRSAGNSLDIKRLNAYLIYNASKEKEMKNSSFYERDLFINDLYTEYQKIFSEYKSIIKLREEYQRKIEVLEALITQSSEQYAK